jgi:NAD(P)H-hydrate epimerase
MGDVLAGIIGSLLSQGFSKQQAAIIGTLMHSLSGDRAADQTPIGLMASDLFGYIRTIRNELSNL